jgi:hypothetical protein
MKRQLKFSLKGYYEPTPANIRKMGDSLLAMSQFMAGFTIIMDEKFLAICCIAIGTIGKFLSNFFSVANETT